MLKFFFHIAINAFKYQYFTVPVTADNQTIPFSTIKKTKSINFVTRTCIVPVQHCGVSSGPEIEISWIIFRAGDDRIKSPYSVQISTISTPLKKRNILLLIHKRLAQNKHWYGHSCVFSQHCAFIAQKPGRTIGRLCFLISLFASCKLMLAVSRGLPVSWHRPTDSVLNSCAREERTEFGFLLGCRYPATSKIEDVTTQYDVIPATNGSQGNRLMLALPRKIFAIFQIDDL